MDKDVTMAAGAGLDFIRRQTSTIQFELSHSSGKIRNAQTDVVQALSAFGYELRDDRIIGRIMAEIRM